jgi:hypothetical protein
MIDINLLRDDLAAVEKSFLQEALILTVNFFHLLRLSARSYRLKLKNSKNQETSYLSKLVLKSLKVGTPQTL